MIVYKFRIIFEEYNDVSRDIEIKAGQTFEQLYQAITDSIGFDQKNPASFFLSDEHWKKGQEFSTEVKEKVAGKALPMKNSKLTNYINDPHQKLNFIIYGDTIWEFFVELFKIVPEESSAVYPRCVKSLGTAPKQYGSTTLGKVKKDLDFLEEVKYLEEDENRGEGDEPLETDTAVVSMEDEPSPEEMDPSGEMPFDEEGPADSEIE